jgi:hypothetical protein
MTNLASGARTRHHGLVARCWAEFNQCGADVQCFRRAFVASGEPALDAGCGTGRLLNEIELMLEMAGFRDIVVTDITQDRPPRPWDDERIVFRATRGADA